MFDPTEDTRREMITNGMNPEPEEKTWTTDQLTAEFSVISFLAPFVHVVRKADGVRGTMMFRHSPRVYYGFEPDTDVRR